MKITLVMKKKTRRIVRETAKSRENHNLTTLKAHRLAVIVFLIYSPSFLTAVVTLGLCCFGSAVTAPQQQRIETLQKRHMTAFSFKWKYILREKVSPPGCAGSRDQPALELGVSSIPHASALGGDLSFPAPPVLRRREGLSLWWALSGGTFALLTGLWQDTLFT